MTKRLDPEIKEQRAGQRLRANGIKRVVRAAEKVADKWPERPEWTHDFATAVVIKLGHSDYLRPGLEEFFHGGNNV